MFDRSQLREGMHVRSADGHSLGKIVRLDADSFIVEKGLFFPKEYVASYERVADVRNGEVFLKARGEELKGEGTAERKEYEVRPAGYTEEKRAPLAEEELVAQERMGEAGGMRGEKQEVTEQRQAVPVTREEAGAEQMAATRETKERAGVTSAPAREEEVEVTKRRIVEEELRVTKESRPEERRYAEEVRERKAEIKETGEPKKKLDEPK